MIQTSWKIERSKKNSVIERTAIRIFRGKKGSYKKRRIIRVHCYCSILFFLELLIRSCLISLYFLIMPLSEIQSILWLWQIWKNLLIYVIYIFKDIFPMQCHHSMLHNPLSIDPGWCPEVYFSSWRTVCLGGNNCSTDFSFTWISYHALRPHNLRNKNSSAPIQVTPVHVIYLQWNLLYSLDLCIYLRRWWQR